MSSVATPASLVASVPADLFSSAASEPIPSSGGESVDTSAEVDTSSASPEVETFETPEGIEDPTETPVEEPTAEETPVEPGAEEQPPAEAVPADDLPEGVQRGKNSKGKAGMFLEESRYHTVYGNHQLIQQVSEVLGEPATLDGLRLRNDAYHAQERMFENLNSGDPAAQGEVLSYIFDEMARAQEAGEVGADPAVPFTQSFYQNVRERSPQAYAELRMNAARDLVGEMFQEAAASGDESLFLSAQHFARALAGVGRDVTDIAQARAVAERAKIPFFSKAEMQGLARGADPISKLREENQRLQDQLSGRATTSQTEQFGNWRKASDQAANQSIFDEVVKPSLATVEEGWKQFPTQYQSLVIDPLNREIGRILRSDQAFQERLKSLRNQAQRATSEQRRAQLSHDIARISVNRATIAAGAVKRPILEFAAKSLKGLSDQTHARLTAAQGRTAPRGPSAPVTRSIVPTKPTGVFDPTSAVRDAGAALYPGR